jgi:hypothetical protein
MSKTSYVYRKKSLCFHSTPSGSYNRGLHFFHKHLTSSRSNFISVISFLFFMPKSKTLPCRKAGALLLTRRRLEPSPNEGKDFFSPSISGRNGVHHVCAACFSFIESHNCQFFLIKRLMQGISFRGKSLLTKKPM